ncbi:MAG TPA: hypothetical protein VG651_07940 [Stellaceae bacterium]|nr:hypothetical protein [Stellaceae bacterium]
MTPATRLALAATVPLLLIIAGITAAILCLCDGRLIYSLDDPYISLALADQIAQGHYGINAGEPSSPASSILYPFLLAVFAWAPWREWAPLLLNTAAALTTAAILAREAVRLRLVQDRRQIPAAAGLIVVLCLSLNIVGLVFIGLEHSLHVLTAAYVILGLARALDSRRVPPALVATIVLLPLWRFEGLAEAGLALLALAAAGYWRPAATAATAIAVALAAYVGGMTALGLPPLPSSVLVKSDIAQAGGLAALWHGLRGHLTASLANPEAHPAFLLLGLIAARPLSRRFAQTGRRDWLVAGVGAGTLAAHILFGAWGWFARYEAYALAAGAAAAIVLWREPLAAFLARPRPIPVAAAAIALLLIGRTYVLAEVATPVASLGIYEQQYQMHRFAAEFYRRPVGVNDLGWVGYRNPNYVLDLWGLGSEQARTLRANAAGDPQWLGRLVAAHGVGLVMIFDDWFPGQVPAAWRRVAALKAAHRLTSPFDTVSFYVTSPEAAPEALAALRAFSRDLAPGTTVTIRDPTNFVAGDPQSD